jgi:hypothetical protein
MQGRNTVFSKTEIFHLSDRSFAFLREHFLETVRHFKRMSVEINDTTCSMYITKQESISTGYWGAQLIPKLCQHYRVRIVCFLCVC